MWLSFWRSRDRFSLDELRFLTEQLGKVQIVNEVNKDMVVEALRSIAEILTYGDQHDASYFEFFMEKQVMGEFVRILKVSGVVAVSVQLLQTMSIMIQNLKSEHAIYYMFSNEYINYLITYTFDFRHEELLSYYISFLRAISGKLNKNTISLLVKTKDDEVISFPLYVEAIRFAFHEENMIRTAVRALTLNVYHVGDESVNKYVTGLPHGEYFFKLVSFFRKRCMDLSGLASDTLRSPGLDSTTKLLAAVDEIEDNLYYFSDVISAGIPDVGRMITDRILQNLILPWVLPSLHTKDEMFIGSVTSLYLLCCILRIVKIKDLANTTAAALFCPKVAFVLRSEAKHDGCIIHHDSVHENQWSENGVIKEAEDGCLSTAEQCGPDSPQVKFENRTNNHASSSHTTLRETLLSYITNGDDVQALGSLFVLATFLQTKELEESMLDAFGILPQRKQHKKLLLQVLVGEGSDEEQLFSADGVSIRNGVSSELDAYLQRLKEQYGLVSSLSDEGMSPRMHRHQVLDALVSLICRANISAETLWDGGWLLRQLLPYSEAEFNSHHHKMLKDSYEKCSKALLQEIRGIWPDLLFPVLLDEWRKCKRLIEDPSPWKEPKTILLQMHRNSSEDTVVGESSLTAGERMCELVKLSFEAFLHSFKSSKEVYRVFVLLNQVQMFSLGRALPDQPPIHSPTDVPEISRALAAGLDSSGPKPGTELKLVDAVPCRIAFERGKERHFSFLALSMGISGWVVLAEELPLKRDYGVVRVAAPLAGCNPRIDEKHPRWLHLRIRPSSLPFLDPSKRGVYGKLKSKGLVDGRWTLAFRDEETCRLASSMILQEIDRQSNEVERRLKPLLDLGKALDYSKSSEGSTSSSI